MEVRLTEQKVQAQYDEMAAVVDVRWHSYITGTLAALPEGCLSSPQFEENQKSSRQA